MKHRNTLRKVDELVNNMIRRRIYTACLKETNGQGENLKKLKKQVIDYVSQKKNMCRNNSLQRIEREGCR